MIFPGDHLTAIPNYEVIDIAKQRMGPVLGVMLPHRGDYKALPEQIRKAYETPSLRDDIFITHTKGGSSAALFNFDSLWCNLLNEQLGGGVTHAARIDDDVFVQPGWVDILWREMDRVDADLIAAVIPIKGSDSGITSTAVDGDKWSPRRLTMKEVYERPMTWTEPGLVLNTGCMLCRFDAPCFQGFSHHMHNRIRKIVLPNGRVFHKCEMRSEDWEMSRYVRLRGGKVYATTALKLYHGDPKYHNHYAWGVWDKEKHGEEGHKLAMQEQASF